MQNHHIEQEEKKWKAKVAEVRELKRKLEETEKALRNFVGLKQKIM